VDGALAYYDQAPCSEALSCYRLTRQLGTLPQTILEFGCAIGAQRGLSGVRQAMQSKIENRKSSDRAGLGLEGAYSWAFE
jgi:hypothetical protein